MNIARYVRSLAPRSVLSPRTRSALRMDLHRLRARTLSTFRPPRPTSDRLHLGCGPRKVAGWYNVDVAGSDYDVDLCAGYLPWASASFSVVISQQVIEHLELTSELLPLLRELFRVCRPGAQLWLACPDLEKVCRSYDEGRAEWLVHDRQSRLPNFTLEGAPTQHIINVLFHQGGSHKNLFDLEILDWALRSAGFGPPRRVGEGDLLAHFPEFPARHDDEQSIYIVAQRP